MSAVFIVADGRSWDMAGDNGARRVHLSPSVSPRQFREQST